ncbi:MAG: hypothetical protein ACOYJ6_17810 [Caulobacterales bacterium]
MRRWAWVAFLVAALGAAAPALAQSSCAQALTRIAPQACTQPPFLSLWATMDALEQNTTALLRGRFERTLRVCRGVAGSDPMPCLERRVWARIAELGRARDADSAVGRYLGPAGRAVELLPASADGYTRIRISLPQPNNRQCAIDLDTWRLRGEQTFVGERAPGDPSSYCDFRLRRIGPDVVIAGAALCRAACAPDLDYAGRYHLQR